MSDEAVLLAASRASLEERKVARLLGFFGVNSELVGAADLPVRVASGRYGSAKVRVLGSAEAFIHLIECLERNTGAGALWEERVHSAFVYSAGNPPAVQKLLALLSGHGGAAIGQIEPLNGRLVVTDEMNDFCGVMSGVGVDATAANAGASVAFRTAETIPTSVISTAQGATFAKFQYRSTPVFLSGCDSLVDIDAELVTRNFDIREHFLAAVPLVLYTKWAFVTACWHVPETSACVVIDDPFLRRKYGFVNFEELLSQMDEHGFSTNIAFIPWNWNRSDPGVVGLFTGRRDRYSLSVHGCDHTAEEFGSADPVNLQGKTARASERMSKHERRTGIRHDPVMVFPQGVFSSTAMGILKRSQFDAAVNTEVLSADRCRRAVRIADVWDVAVMNYESFPLFTRRYPSQGVENFAFDILLGKPCLVVIHHDYCRDQYRHLTAFVRALNALNCTLTWRSIGDVVRRSCRRRDLPGNVSEIEMYGSRLWIENPSDHIRRFIVTRRESDPSSITEVRVGSKPSEWRTAQGRMTVEFDLAAGEGTEVAVDFRPLGEGGRREKASYVAKAIVRRYLSEIRDNYVATQKANLTSLFGRLVK